MKKLILLIFSALVISCSASFAQIFDDFSDGDFTSRPEWAGDDSAFIVNSRLQLQLQAENPGSAFLALSDSFFDAEMEWRFQIRLAFSPSDHNFARVYLAADSIDLRSPSLSGYFLQFGEAGSGDVIELFYMEEGQKTSVLRGQASIASSFTYNIKVTKNALNHWQLWVDAQNTGLYVLDAEGESSEPPPSVVNRAFGFFCTFTSGNRNKFYFDDVYAGAPIVDTVSPELLSVEADPTWQDRLLLAFSEPLSRESALNEQNYRIVETGNCAGLCEFEGEGQKNVRLFFSEDFAPRRLYHLEVHGVNDLSGNSIENVETEFVFYCVERNEVLISEIMADPSPPVGLPECEYLELYNTLSFPISLKNWKLQLNTTTKYLPEIYLPAHSHALLIAEASSPYFIDYENVVNISSLSVSDDEQKITLLDGQNRVMFHVPYSKRWHRNVQKQNGGWALEMMDVGNPCGGKENWDSSNDFRGGTPAAVNSIAADCPDVENPFPEKVVVTDSLHLRLFFSEMMMADTLNLHSQFAFDHNLSAVAATFSPPDFRTVVLTLSAPLQPTVIYTLTLEGALCDCVGNPASAGQFLTFGLPSRPVNNDLIINEVLSNPLEDTDGDFVEIYNLSDKIIDLGQVGIGTGSGTLPDNFVLAVPDGFQLFPHRYAAICKNRELTVSQYVSACPAALLENSRLPALPNDAGDIHLLASDFSFIDRLAYDKSMHYALLNSTDGVSLERIHPDGMTQDNDNWTSAAESFGWATPGCQNSQFSNQNLEDEAVQVVPDIFSPDGDGFNDFTEIVCRFEESEYRISVVIYNKDGMKINQLANNEVATYETRYRWDGQTEDHRAALNGLYVVRIQVWNTKGKTKRYLRTVALTTR